jgi:hypothetical protein
MNDICAEGLPFLPSTVHLILVKTRNYRKEIAEMRTKTNVKTDGMSVKCNQRITRSLKVKSGIKAGAIATNHNQRITRSLK